MFFLRFYKYEIIIFCAALLARLLAFALAILYSGERILHLSDSGAYIQLAQHIATGNGFTLDGVNPFSFHVPGYPAYLALSLFLFNRLWPALVGQIMLTSLIPVLLFRMGKYISPPHQEVIGGNRWRYGGSIAKYNNQGAIDRRFWCGGSISARPMFVAGMLVALEPHLVLYSITYMTEALYAFLFFAGVFLFVRFVRRELWRDLVFSSLLFGISVYVRPVSQYVLVAGIISLGYCWSGIADKKIFLEKVFFAGALMIAAFAAAVAPWLIRNERLFGVWGISSHGSYNLYVYDGASIISLRDGVSYDAGHEDRIASLERDTGVSENIANSLSYDRLMYERGLRFVTSNTGTAFKLFFIDAFGFWTSHNYAYFLAYFYHLISQPKYLTPPTQMFFQGDIAGAARTMLQFLFSPYYFISIVGRLMWFMVALFSGAGIWKLWRFGDGTQKTFSFFAALLFLYFSAVVFFVGLGIDARMRYPVEPLIVLFAVIGAVELMRKIRAA